MISSWVIGNVINRYLKVKLFTIYCMFWLSMERYIFSIKPIVASPTHNLRDLRIEIVSWVKIVFFHWESSLLWYGSILYLSIFNIQIMILVLVLRCCYPLCTRLEVNGWLPCSCAAWSNAIDFAPVCTILSVVPSWSGGGDVRADECCGQEALYCGF